MSGTRKTKGKTYEIHDNGGRPFFVTVKGKTVSVEKNMDTYEKVNGMFVDIQKPRKHLFEKQVDELFVGKKSPTGGYDGLKPKEAEGNSILVRIGSKYMYIGSEIYEFEPVKGDSIVAYYSDVGNSDVPYPYAVGKTHIYIMLDKVAVEKSFFDMKQNIYQQYYNGTTFLPMCLRGYEPKDICKDRDEAKAVISELKTKTQKLKSKLLQKRA
jgi:hypothetical protein